MLKNIAVAAALVIASSAAMAADVPGFYAGADVGTTKMKDVSDRETGYGVFGGYQINQYIAAEVGFRRLADMDETLGGLSATSVANQLTLSAVGTYPLGAGFSLLGRLGYSRINVKETIKFPAYNETFRDHANRGLYGIGVAYAITPAISARLEVTKPMSDVTNLSAGVSYKF
jgi:OOP family OmpA-OmpF porin